MALSKDGTPDARRAQGRSTPAPNKADGGEAAQTTPSEYSLKGIEIFEKLPADALERVRQRCIWRHFSPGELIINYLAASDDVFFITSGQARVTIYSLAGKVVTFRELGAGDVLGEYPAIDGGPRSANVEAISDCLVASMSAAAFKEVLQTEPGVAYAMLPQLVTKIRSLTTRVYEFSTLAVSNRIQAELLRLANLAPRDGKSAHIVPSPTHAEIAAHISTHREAVTRELSRLVRMGVIERKDSAMVVKDVDRLAQMVHDATGE